jgi:hypothetical protein
MEHREKSQSGGLGFVLLVYAASRLFFLVAGVLLARTIPESRFRPSTIVDVPLGTLNIWAHWDGGWYSLIAATGYESPGSPAFFPLYPLLMRSFSELFGGPHSLEVLSLWGVLISLLALPFAFYFVYRIAEDGWGTRVAQGTLLTLAFFPTSFFLNSAYTESLFLALSAGSLWAATVKKNLLLACLLAGLATATRNVGVFLLAPLLYEWFKDAGRYRWRGVYLALIPSGLVLYAIHLWARLGDPLLFYTVQKRIWGRTATDPLNTLVVAWELARDGGRQLLDPRLLTNPSLGRLADHVTNANNAFYLAFLLLAVVLLLTGLWVLPPSLSGYALLLIIPPVLFGAARAPLMSFPRFMLVAFPLFITLAVLLQNRRLLWGWLTLSAAFSLVLCALFVSWRFVA